MASPRAHPPCPFLLLLVFLGALRARPLLQHSSINVAVVFSGSGYQSEVRGRLSGENFVDLPVVVSPVTVLVNDTNPRDLLTRLCDAMATEKLHGVVFEDDVGSGAGAQ
ncbi:glutamate receptor ionotropic, NMDA 2C-like, partial [Nerophis ophidion]